MKRANIGIVLGALLGAATAAHADNILVNPGFETGDLTGWVSQAFGGTSVNVSNVEIRTGADAGLVDVSGWGYAVLKQSFTPVATEQVLEVSLWLKETASGYAFSTVLLGYSDDSIDLAYLAPPIGEWGWFDLTGLLDAGKLLQSVTVKGESFNAAAPGNPGGGAGPYGPAGDLNAYYDDFVVNIAPAPGSVGLFLAGATLLFRRGRRTARGAVS